MVHDALCENISALNRSFVASPTSWKDDNRTRTFQEERVAAAELALGALAVLGCVVLIVRQVSRYARRPDVSAQSLYLAPQESKSS